MPSVNYMKDETVRSYYNKWTVTPLLTQQYAEYFYQFVKACLRLDTKLDISHLNDALYDSFYKQYKNKKQYDKFATEIVILFEHLRNFSNITLN
jgi:hypothetical protein